MEKLNDYLNKNSEILKTYLNDNFPKSISKELYKSSLYSINAGGKRLRPNLCITVWEMLFKRNNNRVGIKINPNTQDYIQILPLLSALEMIHTYSLIHDDLPCMDNDDLRRGIPTNHKVFGEGMAVLAGDALLTESFNFLTKLVNYYPSDKIVNLISYISKAAGVNGMIAGQALDISNISQDEVDQDYLTKVNRAKTGELLIASVVSPAILMGDEQDIKILSLFGEKIGFAFQLVDDVLGVLGSKEDLGKTPNIDLKNNKKTFVQILGVDKTMQLAKEQIIKAKELLVFYEGFENYLNLISDFVINRTR